MSIQKIISIKNVGRFDNYKAKGRVDLSLLNLIFAENSRGKTTLCDIFRSLQTGDGDYVTGRRRLGTSGDPEIEILLEGATTNFKNGTWSAMYSDLSIFDSTFVHRNVFAGDAVDHDQKRNLYRVIVGEQGVLLANRVDELDALIREAGREHNAKKLVLEKDLPAGTTVANFLALSEIPDVDARITSKRDELAIATKSATLSSEIKSRGQLKTITLPAFPSDFSNKLSDSLATISKEAEARLRDHLANGTSGIDESWISTGLAHTKDDVCPFCGQSTKTIPLVKAYQQFFDRAYTEFKARLLDYEKRVGADFAPSVLLSALRDVGDNAALGDFWKQFGGVVLPACDVDAVSTTFSMLAKVASETMRQKVRAPLEAIAAPKTLTDALAAYEGQRKFISEYNVLVGNVNTRILDVKASCATVDVEKIKNELGALEGAKKRFLKEIVDACDDYSKSETYKAKLESDKAKAKDALDKYCDTVLKDAETRLNQLLEEFGAGFQVANQKRSFAGGKTSSTYQIVINGVPIELGDSATPVQTACFRNTLSSGDKSTLALAFFLIQTERHPSIANKTLVFDDPFTSQDRSRRTCTQQHLRALTKKAKQVLVLSHDPSFLRGIWDEFPAADMKTLQLTRMGSGTGTILSEWDIEDATRGDYPALHRTLWVYVYENEGTPRTVAQNIRLVLEQYLRLKLPHAFGDQEWLGDFIKKIRDADPSSTMAEAQVILSELEAINGFSKRYHHSQNPMAATEPIDDTELLTFTKRTLKLVGGF